MPSPASPNPRTLLALEVPVIVEIGRRRLPLSEVLGWEPGTMIELTKPAGEELSLRINALPVATGTAVKVGERFGLRIQSSRMPPQPEDADAAD